jgi:hypothetical protein
MWQKQTYGTRVEYKWQYRSQNPEYVRRNADFVNKSRTRRRNTAVDPVSPTSCDLLQFPRGLSRVDLTITAGSAAPCDLASSMEVFDLNTGETDAFLVGRPLREVWPSKCRKLLATMHE